MMWKLERVFSAASLSSLSTLKFEIASCLLNQVHGLAYMKNRMVNKLGTI